MIRVFTIIVVVLQVCSGFGYAQAPEISLRDVVITLERHGCYGYCPVYTVTVYGDGRITYEGRQYVAHEGSAEWQVETTEVVGLVNKFLGAHFFDAAKQYMHREFVQLSSGGGLLLGEMHVSDLPGTTLTLKLGKREHSVLLYSNIPEELQSLADAVDEVANTVRYITGEDK